MNKDTMGKLIERGAVLKSLEEKMTTQKVGALKLGISERQIRRLYKSYKEGGVEALIHKNTGKPNCRKIADDVESQAIEWLKEHGPDFGSTFAQEKLVEYLNINVSVGTVRTWQIRNGLLKVRKKKDKTYKRRERKAYFGALVQIDGSPHDWFEGRGERCTLLTMIDDATGKIYAQFAPQETTVDLMKLMWDYLDIYGRPLMIYSDHGGPYKVNVGNQDGSKETQLGRALRELNIEHIHANSPQAKGRVERNHGTQQDRLIKEMRLRNISTIEAANIYLKEEYIPQFNQRFTVEPAKSKDVHRSLKGFNLNNIFSLQETRVVQNDHTIQFEKLVMQITKNRSFVKAKSEVLVRRHLDDSITLWIDSIQLGYELIKKTPPKQRKITMETKIVSDVKRPVSQASRAWSSGISEPYKLKHNYGNKQIQKENRDEAPRRAAGGNPKTLKNRTF